MNRDHTQDWVVIYGSSEGVEGYALREVNQLVQKSLPYLVRVVDGRCVTDEVMQHNLVILGTRDTNPLVRRFQDAGIVSTKEAKTEAFSVRITENPDRTDRQLVILTGSDENGVLYAVRDFEHYIYDRFAVLSSCGVPLRQPFIDKFDKVSLEGAPIIKHRGLWTWGHVIYDYKRYLDHLSHWKMNMVVIWNDFVPLNARQIIEYAHERGIKVIWGYSWSWGEEVDPTKSEELEKWTARVMEKYETEVRDTRCDGIYFQIFTETDDMTIGSRPIAELAADWVNHIGRELFRKYPDILVQFGVHATSIRENYVKLGAIDERIDLVWENIGTPGPVFPYSYEPNVIEGYESAVDYTSRVARLRGEKEKVGIVIKGMTNLDWANFEHQPGQFILGEDDPEFIARRAEEKMPRWRYVEVGWRKNFRCVLETIRAIAEAKPARSTVLGLVEDGVWEEKMWLPVALLAEAMWNPYALSGELLEKVAATHDAYKLV
ncbi:MAG TPA: hypothetical protein GX509_09785 [Firmicutes bacterium]|nr:hypothetical protein [Bacillota bacterium]HHY99014.1 hypothetical protein [Bacillota bacterium]